MATTFIRTTAFLAAAMLVFPACNALPGRGEPLNHRVSEQEQQITISTPQLEAVVRKQGYVTGVAGASFLDKATGFRDPGFGLHIVDWVMEEGSDEAYRDKLPEHMVYQYDNPVHGKRPKRAIEGPQICTKAGALRPYVISGADFTAVKMSYRYSIAAPGREAGTLWEQTLLFPRGKRYFISCDRVTSINESPSMFLRIDMPGHIKHKNGDTFSEIYLSHVGTIPSSKFFGDFAPDENYNYRRDTNELPQRFIRACRLRDPKTGQPGPWLAGMTLSPAVVYEAWCHQRGYVCMIEEIGGQPVKPGQFFSAAYIVGYFDSLEEMQQVYDQFKGYTDLRVTQDGWELVR